MALEGIMSEDECVLCIILNATTAESGVAQGLSFCLRGTQPPVCAVVGCAAALRDPARTHLNSQHLLTSRCKPAPTAG